MFHEFQMGSFLKKEGVVSTVVVALMFLLFLVQNRGSQGALLHIKVMMHTDLSSYNMFIRTVSIFNSVSILGELHTHAPLSLGFVINVCSY